VGLSIRLQFAKRAAIGASMLVALCVPALALYVRHYSTQVMGEDAILWETTDAIQVYVTKNHTWPRDWSDLSASLAFVDPSFRRGAADRASNRVVVNFQVDCARSPGPDDWYVHLKSDSLPGEEMAANDRLRRQVIGLGQMKPRTPR